MAISLHWLFGIKKNTYRLSIFFLGTLALEKFDWNEIEMRRHLLRISISFKTAAIALTAKKNIDESILSPQKIE